MRIKALLLALCMIFIAAVPDVITASADVDMTTNAIDFASQLGLLEGINKDVNAMITRAEFAALAVRSMNSPSKGIAGDDFIDVKAGDPFADEIYMAKNLGLTSGTSELKFSPESLVVYPVAAKMLVTVLGYGEIAAASGGYPSGYLTIASNLGMQKGVGNRNSYLTVGDAITMVYNSLYADIAVISSVYEDGSAKYNTGEEKTLLGEYFGLSVISGIITTSGYITISPEYSGNNKVEILGNVFESIHDTEKYFGKNVDLWYSNETEKVIAISEKTTNKEIVIEAKNVVGYSDSKLETENENGNIVTYLMDKGFSFVKNGRIISHNKSDFMFKDGTLRFIDNDNDGLYEFCISSEIEYFTVSAVNLADKTIYDANSLYKCITFDNDKSFNYKIYINGTEASVADIKTDTVYNVLMSDDEKVCRLYGPGSSLSGKAEEIRDDEIIIGGKAYKTNSYFENQGYEIIPGNEYKFLLSLEGELTACLGASTSKLSYGYYLGFKEKKGLSDPPKIKVLTTNDEKMVFELADKVKLDGVRLSNSDPKISGVLLCGVYPNYQMIRYKEDKGIITSIDTAVNQASDWDVNSVRDDDNSLTKYIEKQNVYYRSNVNFGIPYISFKNAVNFAVPSTLATKPQNSYDEDMFYIMESSDFENDKTYKADAYDFDKKYIPEASVIYTTTDTNASVAPRISSQSYIVCKVVDAIDKEGIITKLLKLYNGTSYLEYYIDADILPTIETEGNIPSSGDVIRIAENKKGHVTGISIDVDYKADTGKVTVNYGKNSVSSTAYAYLTYCSGNVLNYGEGFMSVKGDNLPTSGTVYVDNIVNLCVSSVKHVTFDKSDGQIKLAKSDSIVGASAGGTENSSYVVCKMSYYAVTMIFIYVD